MFTLISDTVISESSLKPSDCQITGFYADTKTGLQAIYYCDGKLYYFGKYTNIPHLVECPEILDRHEKTLEVMMEQYPESGGYIEHVIVNNYYASAHCDCPYRLQRLGGKVGQEIVGPIAASRIRDTTKEREHWENQTQYAYAHACVLPNKKLIKQGMYYYIQ